MRWIYGLLLTVILTGCSSQLQSKHVVIFTPGELYPEGVEWKQLDDFILSQPESSCFEIDGPRSLGGFFDPTTSARVSGVYDYLDVLGHHVTVPRQPFWVYVGEVSILIQLCERDK